MTKTVFLSLMLLTTFISPIKAQNTCQNSQTEIETKIQEIIRERGNKINKAEQEVNPIREKNLIAEINKNYRSNLENILYSLNKPAPCASQNFTFSGKVWSIEYNETAEKYSIEIAHEGNHIQFPFFYGYVFDEDDPLINKIEYLEPGNNVKFEFTFSDVYSSKSENYWPKLEIFEAHFIDTGNPAFRFFIDLKKIDITNN